uniref:Uncharacterized protein n=1 Tax=Anopheles dirus TaxID=7168 RepID=A0A182NTM3_9DIPT
MSASRNATKLCELRLKLFGPTLDDSVLYGIDRMAHCFRTKNSDKAPAEVESFYWSCESLPPLEKKCTLSQLAPKLSPEEMDYIIDAIAQSRENSLKHARRTTRAPRHETERPSSAPKPRHSRWAIARINEYDDGAQTYEIMNPPGATLLAAATRQTTPADTEIVFALLPNGSSLPFRTQRRSHQPSRHHR